MATRYRTIRRKTSGPPKRKTAGTPRDLGKYTNLAGKLTIKSNSLKINVRPVKKEIEISCLVKSQNPSAAKRAKDEKGQPTSTNGWYEVAFKFINQKIEKQAKRSDWVPARSGNTDYFFAPPKVETAVIAMRCQCPDFRHTSEWAFANIGQLAGKKRRYKRKTLPPEHREVRRNLVDGQPGYRGENTDRSLRYNGRKPADTVTYDGKGKLTREPGTHTSRPHVNPAMNPIMCKHIYCALLQLQKAGMIKGEV